MEAVNRKPFQGIGNILRFNWHFYALVIGLFALLQVIKWLAPSPFHPYIVVAGTVLLLTTVISLVVSYAVYDASDLYNLGWLDTAIKPCGQMVNIHAGFDETSALLAHKYPEARWRVFDFYNPQKHTEVSIKRARQACPPYPGTEGVSTEDLPLTEQSVSVVFCILSAHEIRDARERSLFFRQLQKSVKEDGRIVVVEHLRDLPNFLAYSIGAFHFHPARRWEKTFSAAELFVGRRQKLTPFVTVYYLQKNGNPS